MTNEDVESELNKWPFIPFRLHLVSGKTVEVPMASAGWMLRHAIVVLQNPAEPQADSGYDVIALRNIERLEQLKGPRRTGGIDHVEG